MSVRDRRPLVLLCECAGTMANIDFDALEERLAPQADVLRGAHWCCPRGPGAPARAHGDRCPPAGLLAGCSRDFADRRFHRLLSRGLHLEIADIREGCAWVHGDDTCRRDRQGRAHHPRAPCATRGAPADTLARTSRVDSVLVIGGGVAGTQAAVELAQMGHRVELVERRPFLGGRAARIGTVFPTNDCGQCLPTTDAQAGTRKCFHRNVAIDDPNLHVWRRTTVESVDGRAGRLRGRPAPAAQHRHRRLHQLRHLRDRLPRARRRRHEQGDLRRVLRRPRGAHRRPRHLHLLRRLRRGVPGRGDRLHASRRERATVKAGAVLTAVGCEPAPGRAHRPPRLRPRRRGHADRARRDDGRLGGAGLGRAAAGRAKW